VAVKVPLVAPAVTVRLAGTVTLALLLDSATLAPPLGAVALSVTVQVDVPRETTLAGLQFRLPTGTITMIPPVPDPGIDEPAALTGVTLATETGADVTLVPTTMVNVTTATTPLLMVVSFMP
jgi:hypothetical protein